MVSGLVNMIVNKWDFKKHEYEKVEIPDNYNIILHSFDMGRKINCIHCKKELTYGECYTSRRYHTEHGFGYPVCPTCYEEEWYVERASYANYVQK